MADINYTYDVYSPEGAAERIQQDAQSPQETPAGVGGAVRMLGALASLALLAGVGIWGYKLMVRDVSGVPVVRALEGPMRIQPVDPGGEQADHQGLAVNAIAANGSAAPTADRLLLAPGPIDLADEDTPQGQSAAVTELVTSANVAGQNTDQTATDNAVNDLSAMSIEALVAQLTGRNNADTTLESGELSATSDVRSEGLTVRAEDANAAGHPTDTENVTENVTGIVSGPGLTRSLRPHARPARALASGENAVPDSVLDSALNGAVDTSAQIEVDAKSLAIGTRLAQLGAYDSAEVARGEWGKLTVKFRDYFENKQRIIQKASSGGRTFYRLRAMGFDDLSAARRFCSALVSENADCIPVTVR